MRHGPIVDGVSWCDELDSDDDLTRICAIGKAAQEAGPEFIDAMLDIALHDPTEVQTTGGVAEVWRKVSDAAAQAIKGILERQGGGIDERIRTAAFDVDIDDMRVSKLLYYLGARYEPVRRELETSVQERLRIRALKSIRPFDRPQDLSVRFLADPSPAVRIEALAGSARIPLTDLERALIDPISEVRLAAAKKLELVTDSEAVVVAARAETDPKVREVFAKSLVRYRLTERVWWTLRGYLVNDVGAIDARIAERLQRAGDTGVSAAIAARSLIDIQEQELLWMVANALLLQHVPEVRGLVEYLHRHAPVNYIRHATGRALEADPVSGRGMPAADGLDKVQQARLLREVLRWAEAALGSEAGDGLKAWIAAPDDHTAAQWITEHDWFGDGAQAELLHAAVDGDLQRALAVELRPGREADLLRLAHQFTAGQIRAGMVPIVPGPLNPLLLLGPDALRVQAVALRLREPVPLLLPFSPEEPASLFVSCSGCGEPVQAMGEVKWLFRHDRGAEFEDGYTGTLTGDCPACGSAARVEVRLSQSTHRFAQTRELSWDAVS
jgi:hypothetical protein